MSDSRTFPGVTPEILSRMKELGRAEHNIVYDPRIKMPAIVRIFLSQEPRSS